jgi:hypothetical protein
LIFSLLYVQLPTEEDDMTHAAKLVLATGLILLTLNACEKGKKPEEKPIVQPSYQKMLSIADVEAIAGLKGLKLVPTDSLPDAKGELNFAINDSTLVLVVDFIDLTAFNDYKEQKEYIQGPVTGLGDEAYSAPQGEYQDELFVRKDDHAVALQSFINPDEPQATPYMDIGKLVEVAKILILNM